MKTKILFSVLLSALLIGCDYIIKDYDFDDNPNGLRDRTLLEYFANSYDQNCTTYCKAISYTGLESEVTAGNRVCIIPNNAAFDKLFIELGVTSLEEINPNVMKSLLKYMILSGDFRAITMATGQRQGTIALSGDSIFISRNPSSTNKYRMLINDYQSKFDYEAITITQQDYVFKNNVIGQVVGSFAIFKPRIAKTQTKPEGYTNTNTEKHTLTVTDDAGMYNSKRNTYYPNLTLVNRGSEQRSALVKFGLQPIQFKEDIMSAKLIMKIFATKQYVNGEECRINIDELNHPYWTEEMVWNDLQPDKGHPFLNIEYAGIGSFNVTGDGKETAYANNPTFCSIDVTKSINKYYMQDSPAIVFWLTDVSANHSVGSTSIDLCDMHNSKANRTWPAIIALEGPFESALTLTRNNPVKIVNGSVTFNPQDHFSMTGPDGELSPDGPPEEDNNEESNKQFSFANNKESPAPIIINYAPKNIIYSIKESPSQGLITLFGLPLSVGSQFTQAQLNAGVVKYLNTTNTTSDSFKLKVLDYLGGKYKDILTIKLQE